MGRIAQPVGERGSLKWIQRAVNDRPLVIQAALRTAGIMATDLEWRSPLSTDAHAEYRDGAFLDRVGAGHLREALVEFWPRGGPQWDALAIADGEVLLVEAKAHIAEMLTKGSSAKSEASLAQIRAALAAAAEAYGAEPLAPWPEAFYQLANRYAFLHFLVSNGVPARLALVNFVGDRDMGGPSTPEAWISAYRVAQHAMGLPLRHRYAGRIHHVFVDVGALG